ncbi:MAG: TetR/AcrR family transcriptional regulator [Saprospiraceae bacterium]|jgi:AcrR family transcriptional regulator
MPIQNTRRDNILQAAAAAFARYGYEKTTLDDISKSVGLNKASLYYYFKNKDDLFVAVVVMETTAFFADLQAKTLAIPDVRRQVRYYLTEHIRRYGEVLHHSNLSAERASMLDPIYREVYGDLRQKDIEFLAAILKRGVAENAFSFPDTSMVVAENLLHLTLALQHEVVFMARRQDSPANLDFSPSMDHMERLLRLVLR